MPMNSPFLSHKNCASIFRQIAWKLGPRPCFAWPRVKPPERGWNLGCGPQRIIESLVKMNSWRSSHVSRFLNYLKYLNMTQNMTYWYDERIYVSSPISGVSLHQNMQDHTRVDGSNHNLALLSSANSIKLVSKFTMFHYSQYIPNRNPFRPEVLGRVNNQYVCGISSSFYTKTDSNPSIQKPAGNWKSKNCVANFSPKGIQQGFKINLSLNREYIDALIILHQLDKNLKHCESSIYTYVFYT